MEGFWENDPSTNSPRNAENFNLLSAGWTKLKVGDTLTYSSADAPTYVLSTNNDTTGYLSVGMKLRLKHGGVTKYFFITAIDASTITLYGGTDYTLLATAITEVFFSVHKSPYGFPMDKNKWTIIKIDTSDRVEETPVAKTWYNLGNISQAIAIGSWNISMSVLGQISLGGDPAGNKYLQVALSTSTSSVSDDQLRNSIASSAGFVRLPMFVERDVVLTSKTTFYAIARNVLKTELISFVNSEKPLIIKAVCTYL